MNERGRERRMYLDRGNLGFLVEHPEFTHAPAEAMDPWERRLQRVERSYARRQGPQEEEDKPYD